ncbi:replication initiator [Actinosynnema sp. NPDC050436]|uniref:replication initiator n=1 Tax=Actinosynnema sp. NPDC050436 TaxID=3155659 RepID=UPI0033F52B6E
MPFTLEDRITARLCSHDYRDWRDKVTATGGCAQPIHLTGGWQIQHVTTGTLLDWHGGDVLVPCGNRRESVCPACSDRYAADAYHLMHAGLSGGSKNIPTTITEKPRLFATVTAPSFGPVHNQPTTRTGKRRPCACGEYHHDADPRLGAPLDPDTYDYIGSVLWQANAGKLWHRLTIALRRALAKAAGLTVREFRHHARVSYAKVAEYQRRGLVHFHAVIRLDGPDGPTDPAPAWATAELVEQAVTVAARSVAVDQLRPDGTTMTLRWGAQVDVRRIRPTRAHEVEENGEISETRLAGYVAKYVTKGTGTSEAADRPIRSQLDIDHLKVTAHHRRIIQTAWDLGDLDQFATLNLRRWAHMLAFRGHFLSKSPTYSTSFKATREERRAFRTTEMLDQLGHEPDTVLLVHDWTYTGSGYSNDAKRELALAENTREQRKRKYEQEVAA